MKKFYFLISFLFLTAQFAWGQNCSYTENFELWEVVQQQVDGMLTASTAHPNCCSWGCIVPF